MDLIGDLVDSLSSLKYTGSCLKRTALEATLKEGPRSPEFRKLVCWLAQELHILRKTDERVAETEDVNEFAMELSAMLKELGCPNRRFLVGALSERFGSSEDCGQLVEYLVAELMASKMSLRLRPAAHQTLIIPKTETNTARAMDQLTLDLSLGKPPENVSPKALFDKLNFKVEEKLRQAKPGVVSEPLLRTKKPLTDVQWQKLEAIHADLDTEYNLRRQMLLTRLEVTIQSFQWSDKMRNRENEIVGRFQQKMQELDAVRHGGDDTNILALLAARADLAIIEKTSSANVRKNTASKIQKHVIGSVPDRGGRAHEHAPPPPEMPSWQQQRASGPTGGAGTNLRGGRGGGGGGRGGGRGGGTWQQYSGSPQQRSGPYEQRSQFDQSRGDQGQWISGSGRVQGTGWSQKGHDYERGGNHYQGNNSQGNNERGGRGGGSSYRGRSNYNRGGGGGHRR